MSRFLDTDEEMMRYMEAEQLARSGIRAEMLPNVKVEYDRISDMENLYTETESGALVRVGSRKPTVEQTIATDQNKVMKDIAEDGPSEQQSSETDIPTNGRWPIESIQGGAGGPVLEDYLAAGYTEQEYNDYAQWQRDRLLEIPGLQFPTTLTPEEIEAYSQEIGAELAQPMDETLRSEGRMFTTQLLQDYFGADENLAEVLTDRIWGNNLPNQPLGGGIDITPIGGLMALQEGRRTFERGVNTGNEVDIGIGVLEGLLGAIELLPYGGAATKPLEAGIRRIEPQLRSTIRNLRGMQEAGGAQ